MDKVGIIKEIDGLGRLVIPKELRERFGLEKSVELIATSDGVLIKNPELMLVRVEEAPNESLTNDK